MVLTRPFVSRALGVALLSFLLVPLACGPKAVRRVAVLDDSVPVGTVEADRFVGKRVPFSISTAGTGWRIATEAPGWLVEQGYEEEGLSQSQVFLFDPATRSSIQISLSPADAYSTFSQEGMEWLAGFVGGTMPGELDAEFGPGKYTLRQEPAAPARLEGVPYAARAAAAYDAGDVRRENGWIYGFAEPFQIFILYQLNDRKDRGDVEAILATFRYEGGGGPPRP